MSEASNEQSDKTPGQGSIDQSDIDALFSADAQADSAKKEEAPPASQEGELSQADIDALLGGAEAAGTESEPEAATPPPTDKTSTEGDTRVDTLGRPFDEAAAEMAAAMEEERASAAIATAPEPTPATSRQSAVADEPPLGAGQLELPEFDDSSAGDVDPNRVSMLNDVNLRVEIELGRTRMLVEDVLGLGEGSVVELDKLAGDPVDVFVNERLIARGEVLVLNDNFCVRISEVLSDDPHRI